MDKIIYKGLSSKVAREHLNSTHISPLINTAKYLINNHNSQFFNFDFNLEVIKLHTNTYRNTRYWIRLIFFLESFTNQTFTLMTLRCNDFYKFPVTLDMNYSDDQEIVCSSQITFEKMLHKLSIKGFDQMNSSLKNYLMNPELDKKIILQQNEQIYKLDGKKSEQKRNSKEWTNEQNLLFLNIMKEYRRNIINKNNREISRVTRDTAYSLKRKHEKLLINKSERAISGHLAYLDDLLAGVGKEEYYAIKDQKWFGKEKRIDNNKDENPANSKRNPNKR